MQEQMRLKNLSPNLNCLQVGEKIFFRQYVYQQTLIICATCLLSEEETEKRQLLSEGFADWTRKDFRIFCIR
jgi:hypothetical protein